MASGVDKLRELDMTREEVERIGEALKNKEFRKLLCDYVEEIQDPENRKVYEKEITQLEKERGVDVTFIHPKPGYVLKTSLNGSQKCFVNICVNELIDKPTSVPLVKDGTKGFQWSLPHSVSPPREDLDNKQVRCLVYDVVFHPETVHLAEKNKSFRAMINTTAMEAVESNYNVQLDKKNVKFPKLQFKGVPRACVRRTPSKNPTVVERSPEEQQLFDQIYKNADAAYNTSPKKTKKHKKTNMEDKSHYTTPKYVIKHRSHVDMQDCTEGRDAKINAAIPKELIVEVNLPLLKSSSDITLDVTDKTVQLVSEKPAKYKLNITLPYNVNEAIGNAKFEKDLKKLIITLPVKRTTSLLLSDGSVEDSGVESDHPGSIESEEENSNLISEIKPSEQPVEKSTQFRTKFLDEKLFYNIPEYTCHVYENIIAFTLNVKNVDENTIEKLVDDKAVHVKFTSISASYYPTYYAFYFKLDKHSIKGGDITVEAWDNNVVVQIPFEGDPKALKSYFYGLDEDNLKESLIQEPSILNEVLEPLETIKEVTEEKPEAPTVQEPSAPTQDPPENHTNPIQTKAIDIVSSYESSGDELSFGSYSPAKSKGILKRFSSKRSAVVRSISESSLDDFIPSSFENCHTSLDSVIPEDSEVSTSLKKTVRFNDNIKRQLYRSNSSILGQKKKNQRKARNKKRANERRHSESELSEVEEKQEGESKTTKSADTESRKGSNSDIFHLDMEEDSSSS